jgi:type II secretory pathway pseudopilin PulG
MRRILLIIFSLAVATGAADPQRSAELERAYQDMVTAQRALEDAKQRRDRQAPNPGKDTDYFDRQRSLEREVALKQWRYDQARERWTALSARPS